MKLATNYVEKPWGRTVLPAGFDPANGRKIGEVWFDTPDDPLPILVKWLFTSEKLSIQVHPNDREAHERGQPSGKEECWFIVDAEPGAVLGMGTKVPLNAAQLEAASLCGEIERLMDWKPVKAGDYFYIPAGTVHAIGAGITLVEVQQNADITYRLYDYGRPRELHLKDGAAVSVAEPYHDPRHGQVNDDSAHQLFCGPLFDLWHMRGAAIASFGQQHPKCWIIPLTGSIICDNEKTVAGECLYLETPSVIEPSSGATALIAIQHVGT
jgi:mannose-6-phosphate isomerase